ncbi:MAG: Tfp pilus assembly protein FimT/FimU [bacterium]
MRRVIFNERGLTLIELCITLLILGLIVAAASPRLIKSYGDLKLKTAAQGIAEELVTTQRRAVLSGRMWRFKVWDNGLGYSVEQQVTQESADQPAWQWPTEWHTELSRRLPKGSKLNPEGAIVEWAPDGCYPQHTLSISNENEKIYEIQIESARITVRSANTREL